MVNFAVKPNSAELDDVPQNSIQTAATCGFSAEDLADIADCFERSTGHAAWVGYGFADQASDDLATIYLFSSGSKGGRLKLRQPAKGWYELLGFDGELLWRGSRLTDFPKVLVPDKKK